VTILECFNLANDVAILSPFFPDTGMLLRKQHVYGAFEYKWNVLSELQDGWETSSIKAHGINRENWKVV
jgi:hypothetical protein